VTHDGTLQCCVLRKLIEWPVGRAEYELEGCVVVVVRLIGGVKAALELDDVRRFREVIR
jgi:hypothetical protein